MAACADGEPCEAASIVPLRDTEGYKSEPGEGEPDQSNKRKPPGSTCLQHGAPKKQATSARASRTRLSLAKKLEVLRLLDEKVAYSEVCLLFGCNVATIRKMKRERRQLELDAASCARKASSKSSRGAGLPEVDKLAFKMVEQEAGKGTLPVTRAKIRSFGIAARDKLLAAASTSAADKKKLEAFGASDKWARNFASRNGLLNGHPASTKVVGNEAESEDRGEVASTQGPDAENRVLFERVENTSVEEETNPSEEEVEPGIAEDAMSAGKGGGTKAQPSLGDLPSLAELETHFRPLEAYAESCGLYEVREHLRKAKMAFLAAHAARTARQSDIRSFLKSE